MMSQPNVAVNTTNTVLGAVKAFRADASSPHVVGAVESMGEGWTEGEHALALV